MNKKYSYGKQTIDADDIKAVADCLASEWLTQGPALKNFEDRLCTRFSAGYASAVSNGTAALHLIGLALGWQPGDVVITTPITFLASANCILYCGATPDFVDIDPVSYTMDLNRLEEKLKDYKKRNVKVKAVVAVDFAGHPCDWDGLQSLAQKYGLQLVDDACHALGAKYKGKEICSCEYADVLALSFHPVKHITTGEGGAVLSNNRDIDLNIKSLRAHGVTKDADRLLKNDGPWYYEMQELGFNYRITDFQCVLGTSQLSKLDYFLSRRRAVAGFYDRAFAGREDFVVPGVVGQVQHAYHLYPLRIRFDRLSITKEDFFRLMSEKDINLQVHYIPVHLQPYYRRRFGFKEGDYPEAERFYLDEVSLPIYPALEADDLEYITSCLHSAVSSGGDRI